MTTRTRFREIRGEGRVRSYINPEWTTRSRRTMQSSVTDWVGRGDNFHFDVDYLTRHGGVINGSRGGIVWWDWENYPANAYGDNFAGPGHLSLPNTPSLAALAATTLARTNPSRASMQSIVSLIETREVPGMLRELYGYRLKELFKKVPRPVFRALRKSAKLNLIIQFGILPILSDLDVCLKFQSLVDQRVKEIERLQTRGLRRTVDLYRESNTHKSTRIAVHSNGVTLRVDRRRVTTKTIRGHARWKVSENFHLSDSAMRTKARRIIAGAYLDPLTAWEALPWSWLVDYFANISDFAKIRRNQLSAWHDVPRIMTHTRTVGNYTGARVNFSGGNTVTLSPFQSVQEVKKRQIVAAGLSASVEFLDGRQLSILGSLAVLKGLR